MPEPTKTIAFRVPPSVEQQIDEHAKAAGQSKGEWVRDQILQVLGTEQQPTTPSREPTSDSNDGAMPAVEVLQAQMCGSTRYLHNEICNVNDTLREASRHSKRDICQLGQVTLDVQEILEERLDAVCLEILDAIERLQQSQRSHREEVIRTIRETA
jgi:hypothetical protein